MDPFYRFLAALERVLGAIVKLHEIDQKMLSAKVLTGGTLCGPQRTTNRQRTDGQTIVK